MGVFLRLAGDYRGWNVYRKAVIICDVTEIFINRAFPYNSRTIDRMRQAARSCKQNIVEGAADSCVSHAMGMKLMGVARASLRELLEDYSDFLRQNGYEEWTRDHTDALKARRYCAKYDDSFVFAEKCRERKNSVVANIMITQIRQLDCMLAGVLKSMEKDFLENGGVRENMTRARLNSRNGNNRKKQ